MSGNLFVISGPSGVGKDSLMALVFKHLPYLDKWVTCTTRRPRRGEIVGVSYFFKTKDQFNQMINNEELIEWNQFSGNFYGTPKFFAQDALKKNKNLLTAIDVNGAKNVKKFFPEANLIFIEPPKFEDLKERLQKRGTDPVQIIIERMKIAKEELKQKQYFDVSFINEDLEHCAKEISKYIDNICK